MFFVPYFSLEFDGPKNKSGASSPRCVVIFQKVHGSSGTFPIPSGDRLVIQDVESFGWVAQQVLSLEILNTLLSKGWSKYLPSRWLDVSGLVMITWHNLEQKHQDVDSASCPDHLWRMPPPPVLLLFQEIL